MDDDSNDPTADAPEQFAWENGAFLIQLVCLASALVMGLVMKHHNVHYIPEAGATLLLGIGVGLVMWVSNATERLTTNVDFNEEIFFFLLLPPIIFESGFSLETKSFFRNFDGIMALALGGTLISTVVMSIFVWLCGLLGLVANIGMSNCLIFGALISATDPVTVLAVFQDLGVNPDLFALVFGESVLNDAVAIVLYRTLLDFSKKGVSLTSTTESVGFFLFVFLGSTVCGAGFAVAAAAFFRTAKGPLLEKNNHTEMGLVMIAPYCAYAAAEFLDLSGIVAILFCGIVMAHYVRPNLSAATRRDSRAIFKTLATLAETFVFLYMGVGLFLEKQAWSTVPFALAALVGCLLARAANVYPMTRFVNFRRGKSRPRAHSIPRNHQDALFVSGLRGAVAFALASSSVRDLGEPVGKIIRTATLMIVIFTVLIIGGATHGLVDFLRLKAASDWFPVGDDPDSDSEAGGGPRIAAEGDEKTAARSIANDDAGFSVSGIGERAAGGSLGGGGGGVGGGGHVPEFRVENFNEGMNKLGARLDAVRHTEHLDLRGKWRAAAAAFGAIATVTTFEDIDRRYIKPYLAPDTPIVDSSSDPSASAAARAAPPPASPAPFTRSASSGDARGGGEDDDGEMTPVKLDA